MLIPLHRFLNNTLPKELVRILMGEQIEFDGVDISGYVLPIEMVENTLSECGVQPAKSALFGILSAFQLICETMGVANEQIQMMEKINDRLYADMHMNM